MKGSRVLGIGCLGILFILFVGTFFVLKNVRSLGAVAMERMTEATLEDLQLPEEDAAEVRESVKRMSEAYKSGEIDSEQLKTFVSEMGEEPVLTVGLVAHAVATQFIPRSGLSAQEKDEGIRTCERFLRGLAEDKITAAEAEAVFDTLDDDFRVVFTNQPNDDDLRVFLDGMNRIVTERNIPNEPYSVDFGAEVREKVNRVLGPQDPAGP